MVGYPFARHGTVNTQKALMRNAIYCRGGSHPAARPQSGGCEASVIRSSSYALCPMSPAICVLTVHSCRSDAFAYAICALLRDACQLGWIHYLPVPYNVLMSCRFQRCAIPGTVYRIRGQTRRVVLTSPHVDILNMSVLTTQKALLLLQESTPYVVGERPVPSPGPKEVLVKIIACALNPLDYRIADPPYSKWFIKSWPYVPGHDAAGIVVQVGAEVVTLKEGDRVSPDGAACQQYATVDADLTAIIPENISFEQAASIPLALTTDIMLLYNQSPAPENLGLRLKPLWEPEGTTAYAGTPAFIIGGSTSLGQYAIQLAKAAHLARRKSRSGPHALQ
ncbi:hypothetical protein NUW54_g12727 [Trametes sanguinea]|uniref:Uncharacterized protein n=1 Tax=Trametes sanguinea TaxID=158606 RepID=A0ACC1MUU8_9APHY|nr:hypothetical protein NUW54_g12727 [Trametes sanguinea]